MSTPPAPAKPRLLHRLGAASGRQPWRVIAIWLVLLAGLLAGARALDATYSNNVSSGPSCPW